MQPIAGYSNGHNLAGGRPSAAKTGTNQLGDTGANRDAWMVGFTPSLSTAVWVGTTDGTKPLVNTWGGPVYGSGLPSDIWKATMDGALEGTDNESFPKPDRDRRLCRCAGRAAAAAAATAEPAAAVGDGDPADVSKMAPGITIPLGPPTTITDPPPARCPAAPPREPPVAPPHGGDRADPPPPP